MWHQSQQAAATAQLAATVASQAMANMANWTSVPGTTPPAGYTTPQSDGTEQMVSPGLVEKSLYCKGFPGGLTMREAQANFRWLDGFVELSLDSREDYSVIYALFYDRKSASKAIHKMNGRVYDPNIPDRVLHVQFGAREMTPSTHGKRRLEEIAAAQSKRPRYEAGNPVPVPYSNPTMVLPPTNYPSLPASTTYPGWPAAQPASQPQYHQSQVTTVTASPQNANPPISLAKRPARPPRNDPCTTLFMPFVPQGVDEDLMRRIFEQQEGLTEVRFRTPKQRHFNLIVFAEFDTILNAVKARENLDGYMVEQCLYSTVPKLRNGLVCDFAGPRNPPATQPTSARSVPMLPTANGFKSLASGFMQQSRPAATAAVVITESADQNPKDTKSQVFM